MTESIVVRYAPTPLGNGAPVYHKYILYTNSQGEQFYTRGGPGYFGPGAENGGTEEASFNPIEGKGIIGDRPRFNYVLVEVAAYFLADFQLL